MSPKTLAIASALLITVTGFALAQQPAVPQPQPIVLGSVTSTTAHTVNVSTTDGEAMTFEFDSRTVKPTDLAADTPVRVEFKMLDSGMHLAQRITPLTPGSDDYAYVTEHRTASDENANNQMAENQATPSHESNRTENMSQDASGSGDNSSTATAQTSASGNATSEGDHAKESMPKTASELPWVLSFGVLSLIASAGLWLRRRRSA